MIVKVAVDLPQIPPLDYVMETHHSESQIVGMWVLVPLRNKLTLGLVTEVIKKKIQSSS